MDHWGPIKEGNYFLVVVDNMLKCTSFCCYIYLSFLQIYIANLSHSFRLLDVYLCEVKVIVTVPA